jgi:rhodanese-related sulfurtransferase
MNSTGHHLITLACAGALLAPTLVSADDPPIASLTNNGELTFSCPAPNLSYKVEWASSPDGPWSSSWDELCVVEPEPGTAPSVTVDVPMFYRVKTPAYEQHIEVVSATEGAALIRLNQNDADFTILDVRADYEYNANSPGDSTPYGHIKGAVNIDYYGPTFDAVLELLPRDRRYLIYCRSSGRSGIVRGKMQALGFHTVYDLDLGFMIFGDLSIFPAHADLIEISP